MRYIHNSNFIEVLLKLRFKVGDVNLVKMLLYASLENTCEVSLDYKIP